MNTHISISPSRSILIYRYLSTDIYLYIREDTGAPPSSLRFVFERRLEFPIIRPTKLLVKTRSCTRATRVHL